MNITFEKLTELSFNDLQAAELSLLAGEDILKTLYENYSHFIALGFDNAQIIKLATEKYGAALSIILKHTDQFETLYAAKFTVADVVSIATTEPNNLEILFENFCFLNCIDELTINRFIECLSGDKSDVERLMKIIEDMLLSLIPTTEQTLDFEDEAVMALESNVQRQETQQSSIGSLMQYCPSTVLLQQTFLTSNELGSNRFETVPVLLDSSLSMRSSLKTPSWFLSESNQHRRTTNIDPSNLIYIGKNNVAKVVTEDLLKDIQVDDNGNIFIIENNSELLLLPKGLIAQYKNGPGELFKKISLCLTMENDQYIGVVFNSDITYGSLFQGCHVITGGTLMRWFKSSVGEKQDDLKDQFYAARKMCENILTKAKVKRFNVNYKIKAPVNYRR